MRIAITKARVWSATAAIAACAALVAVAWPELPSLAQARARSPASDGILLDRHGRELHEYRANPQWRRLEWTPLSAVAPAALQAIVASEDRRFRSHFGVDLRAIARAGWGWVSGSPLGGASTIAMQAARILAADRGVRLGKLAQMRDAVLMTHQWGRDGVLEFYLNRVSFRGELEGIRAASEKLLGRDPTGLDRADAAILASLPRSPNAPWGRVQKRACGIDAEACAVIRYRIERIGTQPETRPSWTLAPALAGAAHRLGIHRTTLDREIQLKVREELWNQLGGLSGRGASNAAALVVDLRSGDVLAYVGSLAERGQPEPAVDLVTSPRQAGSALKPFLYALAIEKHYLTASSPLRDEPFEITSASGSYRPKNHDRLFHGRVSVREALASSLNVPAVRTIDLVGVEAFHVALISAGFLGLRAAEDYGPSLALGSAEVRLWDLAQAYRALALGGDVDPIAWSREQGGIPKRETRAPIRVASPETAAILRDILQDRDARRLGFGSDTVLDLAFPVAAKTGTTRDMRDNWCVAFSPNILVGVWVGNLDGRPMHDVSGLSGAAPAAARILSALELDPAVRFPEPPVTLVRVGSEFYLPGTEPSPGSLSSVSPIARAEARFSYPLEGLRVAWDPDLPERVQKILPRVSGQGAARWRIAGQTLRLTEGWSPREPGQKRAELLDARGRVLDSVQFRVSASGARGLNDGDSATQ